MPNSPYMVALVVAPEFGDRVREYLRRMPVWIAHTPTNRAAAERYWAEDHTQDHGAVGGLTTFQVEPSETPEQWCLGVLDSIDLHHGEASHDPPYSGIEVVGVAPSADLRAAFAAYGLTDLTMLPEGFRASLPPSIATNL